MTFAKIIFPKETKYHPSVCWVSFSIPKTAIVPTTTGYRFRYLCVVECVQQLKNEGYTIIAIEIPQLGTKHSLNVSVSGGVVLWKFVENFL